MKASGKAWYLKLLLIVCRYYDKNVQSTEKCCVQISTKYLLSLVSMSAVTDAIHMVRQVVNMCQWLNFSMFTNYVHQQ
jgi:hypothetical protein